MQERRELLNLRDYFTMKHTNTLTVRRILVAACTLFLAIGTAQDCHAQRWGRKNRKADSKEKVSVQDDLSAYVLAYGEDRTISNGDTVMEYVQVAGNDEESE